MVVETTTKGGLSMRETPRKTPTARTSGDSVAVSAPARTQRTTTFTLSDIMLWIYCDLNARQAAYPVSTACAYQESAQMYRGDLSGIVRTVIRVADVGFTEVGPDFHISLYSLGGLDEDRHSLRVSIRGGRQVTPPRIDRMLAACKTLQDGSRPCLLVDTRTAPRHRHGTCPPCPTSGPDEVELEHWVHLFFPVECVAWHDAGSELRDGLPGWGDAGLA